MTLTATGTATFIDHGYLIDIVTLRNDSKHGYIAKMMESST